MNKTLTKAIMTRSKIETQMKRPNQFTINKGITV